MTAAARALGVVHNPAPRLNLPVKDDAKFVSDRIRARLYRDPRIDPTAKFVAVTIAEWAGDRNMKAWPAQLTLSRMTGYTVDTVCRAIHRLVGLGVVDKTKFRHGRTEVHCEYRFSPSWYSPTETGIDLKSIPRESTQSRLNPRLVRNPIEIRGSAVRASA